jgi:hypothetical protein
MATRGTKITGLNNLSSNLAANTKLVTVDPTIDQTLQTTVQNLGNFVLAEAGNLFPEANVANTVRSSSQPNITSLGTLVSLTVSGTTTLGNTTTGNYFVGNLYGHANTASTVTSNNQSNITSLGNLTSLTVQGQSFLGPIDNIQILGGNDGEVLHTDGNGFLYWGLDDDAFPGGPNTAIQFNNNGNFDGSGTLTFDTNTNTVTLQGSLIVDFISANTIEGNLGNLVANNILANTIDVDNISIGNIQIQGVGEGTSQQVLGIVNQSTQQLGWKTVPIYYINVGLRDGNSYLTNPTPVLRFYPVKQRDGSFINVNTTI